MEKPMGNAMENRNDHFILENYDQLVIEKMETGEIYGEIEINGRHLWSFTENGHLLLVINLGVGLFHGDSVKYADMESAVELTLMARMLEYQSSIGWERGASLTMVRVYTLW